MSFGVTSLHCPAFHAWHTVGIQEGVGEGGMMDA